MQLTDRHIYQQYPHIIPQPRLTHSIHVSSIPTQITLLSSTQKTKIQQHFQLPKQQQLVTSIFAIPPYPLQEHVGTKMIFKQFPWYGANDFLTHHVTTVVFDSHSILFGIL